MLTFVGFHLTFLVQHVLGLEGMPRRVADLHGRPTAGARSTCVSTIGAFMLGISTFPFLWNVWRSYRHGEPAGDNPWDGQTLEWATSSPPRPENFDEPLPADPLRAARVGRQPPRRPGDATDACRKPPAVWRLSGTEVRIYGTSSVFLIVGALATPSGRASRPRARCCSFLVAGLFAIVAGYLAFHERLARLEAREAAASLTDDDVPVEEPDEQYLPHASIWPLELGAGMTLTLCGFAMGSWVLVPGLVVTIHASIGWLLQSRRRG